MQYLPFDVEKLLSKLLSKELKFAQQIESWKQQLAIHPDYNLARFFEEIDSRGTNYVDCVNLKTFLIRCSYLPNDNLLLAIVRRLDLDGDARLNYREFVDAMRPLENYMPLLEKARASQSRNSFARIDKSPLNSRQARNSIGINQSQSAQKLRPQTPNRGVYTSKTIAGPINMTLSTKQPKRVSNRPKTS